MHTHRLVLSTILLASFGTACTALVLGKIGDTDDYKTGTTSSSGATADADKCSLLQADNYYNSSTLRDANACSDCITTNCAEHVEYACNRAEPNRRKEWFATLSRCAQNPWWSYSPPGSGASSYGCSAYLKEQDPIAGEDESAKKRASEICVYDHCLNKDIPDCFLCEVHTQKTGVTEEALLRDDPCGKCLVEGCPEVIVACCGSEPMRDFVEPCAYTNDPDNKVKCQELASPDAGSHRRYGDAGDECLAAMSACYKDHCSNKSACQ
ncbi:MAG TPA: hypothetical protein VM925_00910 [Labilithrix sp.]|nr:hypothetical protein [Labilithrix sp.]